MRNDKSFCFTCIDCKHDVEFSLIEIENPSEDIICSKCNKHYRFGDENIKRQINKFVDLCRQLRESEEILGKSSVAVTIGSQEVKIPFKILLTRLNTSLDLKINAVPLSITFRIEPSSENYTSKVVNLGQHYHQIRTSPFENNA